MRTARFSICLVSCLTLLGCDQIAPQDKGQPKQAVEIAPAPASTPKAVVATVAVDLSTPDRALRSYWAVRDENRRARAAIEREFRMRARDDIQRADRQLTEVVAPAMVADLQANFDPPPAETYSRDIMEVKVESESRAVILVVIRNTTPIPEGAAVSEFAREGRRDGEKYRYVFEKGVTGWQVAEIWSIDRFTGGSKYYPRNRQPEADYLTFGAM